MSIDTEGFDASKSGIGEMYAEILRLRSVVHWQSNLITEKDKAIRNLVSSLAAITGNGTSDAIIVSDAIEAAEAALEKS